MSSQPPRQRAFSNRFLDGLDHTTEKDKVNADLLAFIKG